MDEEKKKQPEPKCEYYDSEHDYCQRYNLVGKPRENDNIDWKYLETTNKMREELILEFKEWYLTTMAKTSKLMELGERYKDVFYALQDRVIKLGTKIKKLEVKNNERKD